MPSRAMPRKTSPSPAHGSGRTENPKSAVSSEIPPSAPGRTTPGWKISKPIPAIPARKSRETTFGSISVLRNLVRNPGFVSTSTAPAVRSVKWRRSCGRSIVLPSIVRRSSGSDGETRSMTPLRRASSAVRFEALRTAASAQVVLRPCVSARPRSDAAASFTTFRRRSLEMFAPLESIGVEEPMFVPGASATTSAASEIHTPADAARAPFGET